MSTPTLILPRCGYAIRRESNGLLAVSYSKTDVYVLLWESKSEARVCCRLYQAAYPDNVVIPVELPELRIEFGGMPKYGGHAQHVMWVAKKAVTVLTVEEWREAVAANFAQEKEAVHAFHKIV